MASEPGDLTPKELEVLEAAARGESAEETARRLWRSAWTIRSHRHEVMAKLGARNIAHAVAIAFRRRLLR